MCVCVCVCVCVAQSMVRTSAREDNPRVSASGLSPVHTRRSHPEYYASCALLDMAIRLCDHIEKQGNLVYTPNFGLKNGIF